MIITCPGCAMRYDLSNDLIPSGGQEVQCPECDTCWEYSSKIKPFPPPAKGQVKSAGEVAQIEEPEIDVKAEAIRLLAASQHATTTFAERRQKRMATLRGWSSYAACLLVLTGTVLAFPDTVTRILPGAAKLYAKANIDVNLRGMDIRQLHYTRSVEEGVVVLAVRGEIANVSSNDAQLPPMRFSLKSDNSDEIYTWKVILDEKSLKAGATTPFVTRLAAPPDNAGAVQISFAEPDEVG